MVYRTTRRAARVAAGRLAPLARARAWGVRLAPVVLVALLSGAAAAAQSTGPAQVARIIDGDTISVRLADGSRATGRLTGVDTPETRPPTQGVEPGGPEASAYTTRRLTGATVRLDRDSAGDDQDADGRLLRYVVLATGEVQVERGGMPGARFRGFSDGEGRANGAEGLAAVESAQTSRGSGESSSMHGA